TLVPPTPLCVVVEPPTFFTRKLQHGWTERFSESWGVNQKESWPGAACQQEYCLMPASARLGKLAGVLDPWVGELEWRRFCQPYLAVTANRTEPAAHPFGVSKTGVEQRHAVDAPIGDTLITRLWIDATDGEGLKRRFCA